MTRSRFVECEGEYFSCPDDYPPQRMVFLHSCGPQVELLHLNNVGLRLRRIARLIQVLLIRRASPVDHHNHLSGDLMNLLVHAGSCHC
ncbi:hypothetical protein D3C76_680080 [compost metagenome]